MLSETEGDVILVLTPAGKLETQCYVNVLPDGRLRRVSRSHCLRAEESKSIWSWNPIRRITCIAHDTVQTSMYTVKSSKRRTEFGRLRCGETIVIICVRLGVLTREHVTRSQLFELSVTYPKTNLVISVNC